MGEHAQPTGPACHSAALLPIPAQLLHHQRGVGFREWKVGVMGNWTRKGRETWQERKGVLRMERDLSWLELGCSDQTGTLIIGVSPSVRGLISAEPRSGST